MKNRKLIKVFICIFFLIIVGILLFIYCRKDNKSLLLTGLVSQENYEVNYNIDSDFIAFTLFNKLEEEIKVEKILIKIDNTVIAKYNIPYTLKIGENNLEIPNDRNLAPNSSITIELYTEKDILEEGVIYSCFIEKEKNSKYIATYYYNFNYLNNALSNTEVYREYKFTDTEAYDQFVFDVEVDSDFSERIEMDAASLTQKYIFNTTYPIPNTIYTPDDYVSYIEVTYGYTCEKKNY